MVRSKWRDMRSKTPLRYVLYLLLLFPIDALTTERMLVPKNVVLCNFEVLLLLRIKVEAGNIAD